MSINMQTSLSVKTTGEGQYNVPMFVVSKCYSESAPYAMLRFYYFKKTDFLKVVNSADACKTHGQVASKDFLHS